MEKTLEETIKLKFEECENLGQEVKKLKVENKILDNNKNLEELISMQKVYLDKNEIGFQPDEYLDQNDKDKYKEVKAKVEKKLEDLAKTWNQNFNARRPLVHQTNAQRYPYFNGYCFQFNKFGHSCHVRFILYM